MKLIALYGRSSCGKSDTLNRLKDLLRQAGTSSISRIPYPDSDKPETFLHKGLTVCVAPSGDVREIVEENLRYFTGKQCDVAVTASRTKGGTVDALTEFAANNGIGIDWVEKSYESWLSRATQRLCNQETAQRIFEEI